MANRPTSELWMSKPSVKRRRHVDADEDSEAKHHCHDNTDDPTRLTLTAIVEEKWTQLHREGCNGNDITLAKTLTTHPTILTPANRQPRSQDQSTASSAPTTRQLQPTGDTTTPPWIHDATHNLRSTSQTRAAVLQKTQDLYATASGIIPPYLLARLNDLGAVEEDDDFEFPVDMDVAERIDQVKYFLITLGKIVDRVSVMAVDVQGEQETD